MIPIGVIAASVRKKFKDNFQRSDSSDLGRAQDGSMWKTLRGTLGIVSSKAGVADPSQWPLAVVDMPTEDSSVTLKGVGQGAMTALWVSDAGNWWGAGIHSAAESCNCYYSCPTCYRPYYVECVIKQQCSTCGGGCKERVCVNSGCKGYGCTGYGCKGYGCTGYTRIPLGGGKYTYACSGYGCNGGYGCTGYGCSAGYGCINDTYECIAWFSTYPCNCIDIMGWCYGGEEGYPCNCGTTCQTCYPQYVKVVQSIASVVSTVATWSVSNFVQSIKAAVKGEVITVTAYADTDATIQTGSEVAYTASGANKGKGFGFSISPSSYNQSNTISSIDIDRN